MEHRRFYYKLAAVFLVAVSILTFFYARLMRGEIEKNVLKAISETARHDMLAIKAFVEFYLDNLGGVEKRLTASGATTLPELREQLK
nr:hypothetical protein [Desulfovibrio sp.]